MDQPQKQLETMIEAFAESMINEAVRRGLTLRLSPVTTLATIMQRCASLLGHVDQASAAAMLHAYADVMESGGHNPAHEAAKDRFMAAADSLSQSARAQADFPTPQGRA